ncbi:related to CSF1 protein [Rhynchosporium graminicola]|uniref:Related to CSF1 protein n=1 Tax=Rhynchosporium graminicola TaxID=2792576 RepID=A0A1E1KRM0_9HELO|nr:related to CSF1 protein [Rhynchosporium commune]
MSSIGSLQSSPLRTSPDFNWVFLVELGVSGILTLFFLFYFNRVFATFVSYGLRAWSWHVHRVYIDIQALQFSLLGGRFFFKGLRYHGNNETILIQSGFVTWRYWLRNVKELDVGRDLNSGTKRASSDGDEVGGRQGGNNDAKEKDGEKDLPCRLSVNLRGVEWFVYNRSAAYDAIIAGLTKDEREDPETVPNNVSFEGDYDGKPRRRTRDRAPENSDPSSDVPLDCEKQRSLFSERSISSVNGTKIREPSTTSQADESGPNESLGTGSESAFILRFLPVQVNCEKAAVVLGNENTKSVLITKFDSATGEINATRSTTTLDQYKQLIDFQFEHPVIQMKPNDDYKEDQTDAASRIKRGESDQPDPIHSHSHSFFHRQRRKVWHGLQDLIPAFRSSVESLSSSNGPPGSSWQAVPGSNNWQGLSRYLDENLQDDKAKWSSIEYATVSTIADCPAASMCFYWDVVGTVPNQTDAERGKQHANINGDIAPEWGINLCLTKATINYGPWADRQRADIQRVFFPSLCKDATPSKNLVQGQSRAPVEFKMYIEFYEETILRVPIREDSKNWKWTKQADTMGAAPSDQKRTSRNNRWKKTDKGNPGPEVRPFGWLDVKVGANATAEYAMDMVAGHSGYSNKLSLDLPDLEITTSVNHGLLWKSVDNRVACNLSNPLQWNAHRTWKFDINSSALELFILREHVFLLTDLVDDWANGPLPEYLTFTPFKYMVNLELADFRIYLNVNDANIINNPSDLDDNTFIIIFGSSLSADIAIPLENFRPHLNNIPFKVSARNGGLNLNVPSWSTQATFMETTEIATLKELEIDGTYQYNATTATSNTDTLLLKVYGLGATPQFYGFVIRYYLKVKDNYFGDDIRFRTLEEYQDSLRAIQSGEDNIASQPPHKIANDLDVILSVSADNSSVILPSNLYTSKNHVRIDIASLAADLRFTNYYMDLEVVLSPLAFSQGSADDGTTTPMSATSSTQLFIDGVNVYGHRLFGLPPTEPTYICNWDFAVGAVTGECTAEFITQLANGGKNFGFSFDDEENALPLLSELVLHDVTFLRASIESVRVWLHAEEAAFLVATETISVNFNDWAGSHYSKKLKLEVPGLQLSCVDAESASRHRSRAQTPVETHALVQTTISLSMIHKNLQFAKDRQLQQEHIKRHDQRTHRSDFLLHHHLLDDSMLLPVDPPAMCVPPMPLPITQDFEPSVMNSSAESSKQSTFARRKPRLGRKSSFLSFSSSSQKSTASILRSRSIPKADETLSTQSRSRSLHVSADPGRLMPLRDISVSTGRQSSFYSAIGEHRGLPPSTATFSSSYSAPYFPLEGVEPDLKDLPSAPAYMDDKKPQRGLDDIHTDRADDHSAHASFMLDFPAGIQGVFNPKAAIAIVGLLAALAPVEPLDLLDHIQIESVAAVLGLQKQKVPESSLVDFHLCAPAINLRFINSSGSQSSYEEISDQYDCALFRLAVSSRSQTVIPEQGSLENVRKSSAIHISLASAGLAAKERLNYLDDPQAAVNALIEDVTMWTASNKEVRVNVAFKAFKLATASSKIEYLASIIHRTKLLGVDLAESFSSQSKLQRNRVRLFTYLIATTGQEAADALFMTKPSYVLRSSEDHLRTNDSWKIVTRLRHMYNNLNPATQQELMMRCLSNTELVPEDAQQRVHACFDQWRSWDLNNIRGSLTMITVYGSPEGGLTQSKASPLTVSLQTENFRLLVDPGPKQNEVTLSDLTAVVKIRPSVSSAEIGPQEDTQLIETTVVQVFCSDASINLHWELCELAEDIIKLYSQSEQKPAEPQSPVNSLGTRSDTINIKPKQDLQVLVATDNGSITIDTINVRAACVSKGLKASFLMIESIEDDGKTISSLTLAAEAVTSKMKSHFQELSIHQLRYPTLYASYDSEVDKEQSVNVVKVAANCQDLSLLIRQDVLALIEVLDLVVGDELAQLHQLSKKFPHAEPSSPKLQAPAVKGKSITRINVALFLDKYYISIPLLQSLTYIVSGVVARASLAAQMDSEILFDFDIKEHSHDFQTTSSNQAKSISLLRMPPTNGRITSRLSDHETTVSVMASVEPVELDAAAVHSLLTALNRPEISSVVADIQDDLKIVQSHIEEIFGPKEKQSKQQKQPKQSTVTKGKPLIYEAHLTLAGFDLFANAPGADKDQKTARLDLNLGCIQLVVANRLEPSGLVLELPELRMNLREIMFELSRWNGSSMEPCGNLAFAASLIATSKTNHAGDEVRSFHLNSDRLQINLFADTASSVVDVIGHLQHKIRDIDLSREKKYLRKLRKSKPRIAINDEQEAFDESAPGSMIMFASMYSLELLNIQVSWLVGTYDSNQPSSSERENLVLSLKRIDLSTRKENSARLTIEDLQLQLVPTLQDKTHRSLNSALLPEVKFNVGYVSSPDARRLAFQAAGKSLDLRLTSQFMIPAAEIGRSIGYAADKVRAATASWTTSNPTPSETTRRQPFFGKKRMESLLIDADFAGAVVYLSGKKVAEPANLVPGLKGARINQPGKYGQFSHSDAGSNTTLRAPGLAWKVEYKDNGLDDPSLNAEVKVAESTNTLEPSVVPLIMEISSTVKEVVSDDDAKKALQTKSSPQKLMNPEEDNILTTDPTAVLGRTSLNLGLRICRQEFSLSCQPIARVEAVARFDEIYLTINTVRSTEQGHFFAASAAFTRLQASVQHAYSRESTGSFDVDSIVLSMMNSKHVSGTSGVSAILKISPMKVLINAKQLQDFLLFREIWVPPEIRQATSDPPLASSNLPSQTLFVQRYQQVAATGAFPWNAAVSIAELDVQLDLGQAIGKSAFIISNFWISSKKNSDWEQNLCLGFDKVGVDCTGRMSGYVALQDFKLRTSIQWPAREMALNQTPLVQGSLAFSQLRVKAAFDYQAFLVADITSFTFFMYNVRNSRHAKGDRLVAVLDGEAVQVFCTTTTASQFLALYQAFERLVQEKRSNYETSLAEIDKKMKRKSIAHATTHVPKSHLETAREDKVAGSPISLHTDVIVTLKAVNMGVFPNTFSDHQVFKLEALDAQARFAVTMDNGKIHSNLGLTLGQLRIGLAGVRKVDLPKSVGEISVEDVVSNATGSRGGTILKVPKVEATMRTWQVPGSNHIDYIFKSFFEGKVEVGWNYSRISYIRSMYASHSKALAQRLGKPLPPSAVKITGVPDDEIPERKDGEQQKITAEVNVPQSKYNYTALEPPVIETPQLRDMGEATPPLEWIGLHRDRLPNLTHQIVIVTLLELASEVEDAYSKILGSS